MPDVLPDIGLIGRKRHGKDTAAQALLRHGYTRVSFADGVRAVALAIDPIVEVWKAYSAEDFGVAAAFHRLSDVVAEVGWEAAKDLPEVRRLLQRIGTEGVRDHLGEDAWVNLAMRRADQVAPAVFTDVRFPNEAEAVKARGGYLVRIIRPDLPSDGDAHASETALDAWDTDYEVVNGTSVEALHEAMDRVFYSVRLDAFVP